jgi:hypothetical protein
MHRVSELRMGCMKKLQRNFTILVLGITSVATLAAEKAGGRWCSIRGVTTRESISTRIVPPAPFLVECDGKGEAHLKSNAQVLKVGISVNVGGRTRTDRFVVWTPEAGYTTGSLGKVTNNFHYANLPVQDEDTKKLLMEVAAEQEVRMHADPYMEITSIQISAETPVYASADATTLAPDLVAPKIRASVGPHVSILKILNAWSQVPAALWTTQVSEIPVKMDGDAVNFPGDSGHQPLFVLQGVRTGVELVDYIITPENIFIYPHDENSEYQLEIPGTKEFPSPVFVEGTYSVQAQASIKMIGIQTEFVKHPRVTPVKMAKATKDVESDSALQTARALILQMSRNYRAKFDSDPRFQSAWCKERVYQALEVSKSDRKLFPNEGVPANERQFTQADELSFFENYVRRERAQY